MSRKRLQKRSIDDNLRQLVLTSDYEFFFYFFKKNGSVRRWEMKHFMGMALWLKNLHFSVDKGKHLALPIYFTKVRASRDIIVSILWLLTITLKKLKISKF